jgi:lectin-like protein
MANTSVAAVAGVGAPLRAARGAALGCWLVAACLPLEDPASYTGGFKDRPSSVTAPARGAGGSGGSSASNAPVASENTPREGTPIAGMPPGASAPECRRSSNCGGVDAPAGDAGVEAPGDARVDAGPPLPARPPECQPDETPGPNGNCYFAVATLLEWPDARLACQARGGDLTTIRSQADNDFVKTLSSDEVWAGGSDLTLEGTWAWVTDGFQFWQGEGDDGVALNGAFAPWFPDEPNGEDSSDCLRVLADGTWADLECGELRASICEAPKR